MLSLRSISLYFCFIQLRSFVVKSYLLFQNTAGLEKLQGLFAGQAHRRGRVLFSIRSFF